MVPALREYAVLFIGSWTSGISLYLTIVILGISDRAGWVDLPGSMEMLSNPLIIGLAGILFAIEFIADKIPYVDSLWDSFHTLIRPGGAATLGFMAGVDQGPVLQTALALMAGTFALDAHALKSSTRLAINTSPEPFSNITASVAENSFVIFIFWFFMKHPILAILIIIGIIVLSFFIIRLLWGFAAMVFKKIFGAGKVSEIKKEVSA